jgi:GNAT superfamily N-acetyltransferase
VALRHARRADLPEVVDIWVDAFARDPFHRWVQPDDTRWADYATAWMTYVAELVFERGHTFLDDDVAVAWIPPDLVLVGPAELERGRAILATHAGESRAEDALATIVEARGCAPADSHWTLQYLGVRSAAHGRGRGADAVAPGLATIDRDGFACDLISTNPRNVSFYERHGFTLLAEVATPDAAVHLRPMYRAPRP